MKLPKVVIYSFFLSALLFGFSCSGNSEKQQGNTKDNVEVPAKQKDAASLYNTNCAICHGRDGKKGISGATDLSTSDMTVGERIVVITEGKGRMMPFEKVMTKSEIQAVAEYTKTLN